MGTTGKAPEQGESTPYLVKCDVCSFERTVDGRDEATRVGNDHRRETGHDIVALEVPPSIGSA